MKTTIDRAGRLVLPKALRQQAGIGPGEVEINVVGTEIRISAVGDDTLVEENGRLVIPATGNPLTDEQVRNLIDAGRR